MSPRLVTVFGGTGFIGRHFIRVLAKSGARIRVATRRPNLAHFLKPMGDVGQIQLAHADFADERTLREAIAGADAVVNLVGILTESFSESFQRMHADVPGTLARLAAAAGARQFVHVSALGADLKSRARYARSKAQGEAAVRAAFPGATIMRPSLVFGPEDEFFNRFAKMAAFSPVLPLIGGGKTKFQPAFVGDVAQALRITLEREGAAGKIYELGGPSVYTFEELMAMLLKVIERRRLLLPIPFFLAELQSYVLQFLPGKLLTPDQVTLLKSDNIVSGAADISTFADLGVQPVGPEAILPSYLTRFRPYGQFSPVP
ncbi:MAG: NAD-dependent epimerase/dehydratase family protein [Alphaproteobacteria bacterium]|nr:NAD-dependent epimerase/dehydratase family protein [Alphaproteobacteria bacterium]